MAQWHLDDLENALKRRGWEIFSRHEGDNYRVSGTWAIQRSRKAAPLLIDFEGLHDLQTFPMEKSYGCHIREKPSVTLYFSRKGHKSSSHRATWKENLSVFVTQLNELAMD